MDEHKLTSRQIKADKTRANIYDCSMKLFAEHRYETVKIVDICERANVSVGTFYYYFKSKEDVIEYGMAKLALAIHSVLDDYVPVEDPLENIRYCCREQMKMVVSEFSHDLAVILSFRMLMVFAGEFHLAKAPYNVSITEYLTTQVERAYELGIFKKDIPVKFVVEMIRRQSRSDAYEWALQPKKYDLERTRMIDLEMLFDALKHESPLNIEI